MTNAPPRPRAALALCLLLALCLALAAPARAQSAEPAPGEQVVVRLATGETLTGRLVSRDRKTVVLSVAGIETSIQRRHVERITRERTPMQRYRSMRAIIEDDDVPRLLLLVEWLMQKQLFEEARAELDAVLDQEPASPAGQKLDRTLNQQIKLAERSARAEPRRDPDAPAAPEREPFVPPGRFAPGEFPLLTDEQINLYKVYEIDLDDTPRLIIDRPVVEQFITSYAGAAGLPRTEAQRDLFLRKEPVEILELMFALRARELYQDVRVLDLPASLESFRDNIAGTWLTRNCGSTNCHGGTDAPPPYLFNRRPFSEKTALTNLLILERYRFPSGEPMINYNRPGDSPLLQLALPRPEVRPAAPRGPRLAPRPPQPRRQPLRAGRGLDQPDDPPAPRRFPSTTRRRPRGRPNRKTPTPRRPAETRAGTPDGPGPTSPAEMLLPPSRPPGR